MQNFHDRINVCFGTRFLLLCAVAVLLLPIRWIFGFLIAVIVHEFSHYIALKLMRVQVYAVEIRATGVIIGTGTITPIQELICAISGPIGGLVLMLVTYRIPYISVCAFIQSLFNLLPLGCLDGGRALRCLLTLFMDDVKARSVYLIISFIAGMAVAASLLYFALLSGNALIHLIAFLINWKLWLEKYLANRQNK